VVRVRDAEVYQLAIRRRSSNLLGSYYVEL
jgi:hypothetical protein